MTIKQIEVIHLANNKILGGYAPVRHAAQPNPQRVLHGALYLNTRRAKLSKGYLPLIASKTMGFDLVHL